jgi:hypothetical protein
MRSLIAALRTLTLPWGLSSGKRIVLNGILGRISVYNSNDVETARVDADTGFWTRLPNANPALQREGQLHGGTLQFYRTGGNVLSYYQENQLGFSTDGIAFATLSWGLDAGNLSINVPLQRQGEGWNNLGLQNGWVSSLQPQYRLYPDGDVQLRGRIANGTNAVGTVVATLPAGYRLPAAQHGARWVCGRSDATAQYGMIQVESDGDLVIAATPTLASLDLSGIRFSTLT